MVLLYINYFELALELEEIDSFMVVRKCVHYSLHWVQAAG